jgi:uncharacterized protein YxjI
VIGPPNGEDVRMPNYLIRKQLFALGDDFWVEDEAGEKVFHIDGKVLRPRSTFVIETADGQELLKVKEQRLKLRKTYAIERGGEEIAKVAKALVNPLRDRFDVEVAGGGTLQAKGDLLNHEFSIEWEGGVQMAEVSKRWFTVRDTYGVSVGPTQDAVLAIAIAVCIDAIERDQ